MTLAESDVTFKTYKYNGFPQHQLTHNTYNTIVICIDTWNADEALQRCMAVMEQLVAEKQTVEPKVLTTA